MKQGYLMRGIQEQLETKGSKWVDAWKIVDAEGKAMIFPWDNTRKHALETAQELGIEILGEYDGPRINSQ